MTSPKVESPSSRPITLRQQLAKIIYDVAFKAGMKGVMRQTDGSVAYEADVEKAWSLCQEIAREAEERGRKYSLNKALKNYMAGEQVDALTMVKGFANIFIAIMCIDTNADNAEITLKDLNIKGKPAGTWKVTAELTQKPPRGAE